MHLLDHPSLSSVSPSDLDAALRGGAHDALVLVGPAPLSEIAPPALREAIAAAEAADATLRDGRGIAVVAVRGAPGGRVVLAVTPPLASWELDVRLFTVAAAGGVARAVAAGATRPLLVVRPSADPRFARAAEVALLGAASAGWEPFELRVGGERTPRVATVTIAAAVDIAKLATLERGRIVARDICGTEPELMAPEGMARYCEEALAGLPVQVEVLRDVAALAKGYPLIGAVARASMPVVRHHPRIIKLVYEPEGAIERTLFLAGKGLTYDTGGADLKTDGHMAGMSRDKGGAAAIAGLFRVLGERRPKGVRVVGLLGAVRNSIGSDSFVTDEIIRSRAGVRVRIGNTDAEGRLVLADLLAALREEAERAPAPTMFTVATLTGHAALAMGPYTALVENGAARTRGVGDALQRAGDALGDPIERSTLRSEDYAFVAGKSAAEDVLSCNSLPSSRTPRGHQFPAAFIDIVSGLRAFEAKSPGRVAYVHVDIAGSALTNGNWQTGTPTGAPVIALAEGLALVLSARERAREVREDRVARRRVPRRGDHRVDVEPFFGEDRSPRLEVTAHHVAVDLGVELDAARAADLKRGGRLERGLREHTRAGRSHRDRIHVGSVHRERRREPGEERIFAERPNVDGADLAPASVLPHLAAERLREELVAEADPQHGDVARDRAAEERLGREHPARALGHARGRAGEDEPARLEEGIVGLGRANVELDDRAFPEAAHRRGDPTRERPAPLCDGRDRITAAEDHEGRSIDRPIERRDIEHRA